MHDAASPLGVLERAVGDARRESDDERQLQLLRAASKQAGSTPVRVLVERLLSSADRDERVLALTLAMTMSPVSDETRAWAHEQRLRLNVGEWFRGEDRAAIARLVGDELASTEDPAIAETAIYAVAHMEIRELLGAVLGHAEDDDADVRAACAWALNGLEEELSQRSIDALVALARDPVAEVRDWATFALGISGPIDTPAARAAYRANVADPDEDVRAEAVRALALLGDADCLVRALSPDWLDIDRGVELARELGDARLHGALLALRDADWGDGGLDDERRASLAAAIEACRR